MEKKAFLEWLSSYTQADQCLEAFYSQNDFFRVNTLKISPKKFREISKITVKPLSYDAAFQIDENKRFEIGKTWEYFLGLIYPQSLPSILTSLVLNPNKSDIVLDVAASPGSKFSHIAMLMENKGILVGNELKEEKISALYATINRMNILNCIVTIRDGSRLDWRSRFSKVLLDAPCTALGSGAAAWERWQPDNSSKISALQKRMLFSAYDALKPGGTIVYSTCTYAKEENEEVVKNLLDSVPSASLENVDFGFDFAHEHGLSEYGNEFRKCCRVYPQHLRSEGFFMAKIRKAE